ncbi:MAG: hypothetical protein M0Z84_07760 [Gammaproteobacteria bacterium]|nr:hypothetical protein [Gammaproteobacteria bacterium]
MSVWNQWTLKAAIIMMMLGVCTEAQAGCHASDFNVNKMLAAINAVNAATLNLRALQGRPGISNDESDLLGISGQTTDRSAVGVTLFLGYIEIYGRLINEQDRLATDDVIANIASVEASSLKKNADFLTLIASGMPHFSGEIRNARDGVRKLQALFVCVHDGAPH